MPSLRAMKCDNCHKKKASTYITQMVDGKLKKANVCPQCAEENGINNPTGYDLLSQLEAVSEETPVRSANLLHELACPSCGFSHTDFKKTGRFGCAECYQVFNEGLDSLLEAMHKHTSHVGKVPFGSPQPHHPVRKIASPPVRIEKEDTEERLSNLRAALSKSIDNEDYEEAARIRDEISQIESSVKKS